MKNNTDDHQDSQLDGLLSPLLQKLRFRAASPYFEGKSYLDVGSSLGEVIELLPENSVYVGIEGSPEYYKGSKELYPDHEFHNLYLDSENVLTLPLKRKFDTIIMLAVLEHLEDPAKVLEGLRKYLNNDGRIVLTTPSQGSNPILDFGSKLGIFSSEMDEHKELFSKESLIELSKKCGYKVDVCRSFELGMNLILVLRK